MKRFVASILGLCLLLGSGKAEAQSFAAGTKAADNVTQAVQKNTDTQNSAPKSAENSSDKEQEETSDQVLVNSVEKNFGAAEKQKEKEYDNKYGAVINFHFEGEKVVFDSERNILIYYDNYNVERGLDGLVRCSMRIYVLNDLQDRINSLGVKLKWPEISTTVQMNRVNPGVRTYSDIMLLGDGCYTMDKAPTIEVNRCRVKGMSEDECADAIRWFRKNQ